MKKLLLLCFVSLFLFVALASCNDDGTGEPREKVKNKVLIDTDVKPLNKQYAAIGITVWILVSTIGYVGHKMIGRNPKTV